MLAVLAAVVIKTIAAELPLIALRGPSRPAQDRTAGARRGPKPQSCAYGLVQTAAGLLDQTDLITRRPPPIIGRASTKGKPSGRTGSGLPGLLVWISGRAKRQPVARFSVGDEAEPALALLRGVLEARIWAIGAASVWSRVHTIGASVEATALGSPISPPPGTSSLPSAGTATDAIDRCLGKLRRAC